MTQADWQPIATAPRDGSHVLLYGITEQDNPCGIEFRKPLVFSGYFDRLDDAWCSTGSHWTGPFFDATHWAPLPEPPQK